MSGRFIASRENGRSDRAVVVALVKDAAPGREFAIDDIIAELRKGTERAIGRPTAGAAVRAANHVLLKEHQRCLQAVRGVGYRIAKADEHRPMALERKRRSDTQLKRGLEVLSHVRWDEMQPEQRAAHEGTLLVIGAIYQGQRSFEERHERRDAAIHARLNKNDEQLEELLLLIKGKGGPE